MAGFEVESSNEETRPSTMVWSRATNGHGSCPKEAVHLAAKLMENGNLGYQKHQGEKSSRETAEKKIVDC